MSKSYWLTPEEVLRRKKMKKNLVYTSIVFATIILSALLTIVSNQL
ncbi:MULTISPECIES: hypothetical protein [Neobacillus]|uniref:Uncharacterized protein n=3 Tax=Neobacillus TaxID=2675232 RepID=A0A942U8P4_9BACI|nr:MULTISPECIES: hypothetical protein [Neobacillus]MBS4212919.1 hypothetical protein [Neobacillus rhizophilus]MBU8918135.1 hypothetical protein [Bacillus sp. FJAT-29953]MCH6264935.1 hypothetical protein [Neobacillus citreus]